MQKIYNVVILQTVRDNLDQIWSSNVLERTLEKFETLKYFPYLGHPYKTIAGRICYSVLVHPFVYFYKIDEQNQTIFIFSSFYGTQDY
jgi:mRNA-degrading endonuclease RelE of RelBE toxin-antitoxin system